MEVQPARVTQSASSLSPLLVDAPAVRWSDKELRKKSSRPEVRAFADGSMIVAACQLKVAMALLPVHIGGGRRE